MLNIVIISFIFISIIIFFFILPYLVIKIHYSKNIQDSFKWMIQKSEHFLPFSVTENYGMGQGLIYCPHPFTNWSLNPTYANHEGENNHTIEGFRKTTEGNSIIQLLRENPNAYKIVCVGGSTTYCSGIFKFQKTWPAILNRYLKEKNVLVFNFGVSGWGTLQSVIRCLSWLPLVRPQLLMMYQAKNELTPLFLATKKEHYIYPDYQNVMGQFSEHLFLRFPKWVYYIPIFSLIEMRRLRGGDFYSTYQKPTQLLSHEGFDRFNSEMLEGTVFRTEVLLNICKILECEFLYIPEIIRGSPYADKMEKIYPYILDTIHKYEHGEFLDIRPLMPTSDEYFQDKLHFTEQGCEAFAKIVAEKISSHMVSCTL